MNDRLQELLRQRSLVQEHLAWLDREIVASSGSSPASLSPAANPVAPPALPTRSSGGPVSASAPAPADELDPLLAEYREEPESLAANVKRGCFIYFSIGMAVMFITVFLIYLHYAHRTPPGDPTQPTKALPVK